jgi:LEA14-like dessication related protein
MNNSRSSRIIPAVFLLAVILCGCKVEPVTLTSVKDVKFGNIDFLRGTLSVDMGVEINNPNNFAVTVYGMDLNVTINGASLGTVFVEDKVKIKKDTQLVYRVNVNAKLTDILNGLPKILAAIAAKQANVTLKGSVNAGAGFARKKFPVDFKQDNVSTGSK